MDGDDVSSTTTDELPLLADPELPPPPTGPTDNDIAFALMFARRYGDMLVLSRLLLGGPNTGRSAIFAFDSSSSTRDDDGGGDPRHGDDVDVDADADAGVDDDDHDDDDGDDDDDDAYDGFGFSYGAVPASGVAIACLPETTVGEEAERGQCAVCLDEYVAGDALRTMPCAHGFHERCIFQWLSASRLCPLCRFPLPPDDEDTETDEEEEDDRRAFEYL